MGNAKARSILKMQDPDKTEAYLATAQTKPSLLLIGENPRLIDEWQMAPVCGMLSGLLSMNAVKKGCSF
jgi:hypothetical protein